MFIMPHVVDPAERAALDDFESRIIEALNYISALRVETLYSWQLRELWERFHAAICTDMADLHGEFLGAASAAFWDELDALFDAGLDIRDDLPLIGVEVDFEAQVRNLIEGC